MTSPIIPNWLSGGLALAYFPFALVTGVPAAQIAEHALIGGIALVVMIIATLGNILPGGTAKLLAAAFLWFGVSDGFTFTFLSMLPCGIAGYLARSRLGRDVEMPYLPFAAAAALFMVAAPRLLAMSA